MLDFIKTRNLAGRIACLLAPILLLSGCGGKNSAAAAQYTGDSGDTGKSAVRIAYYGRIDEAPLYAAYTNGFFKNNGIDVELAKIDDSGLKTGFDSGRLDAVTADYRFFRYIEDGLALKLTAGLTAGCFRIIVPSDSKIADVKGLKGARTGVEAFGDGTMILASMFFKNNGINPAGDVDWKQYGQDGYAAAFENGEIDAACVWEPSDRDLQLLEEKYRTIYTNVGMAGKNAGSSGGGHHNHGAGLHFTRTFTGLSEKLLKTSPEKSASITKAWLEGAAWAAENGEATVKLAVDGKYVSGTYEENLNRFSSYMWTNGIKDARVNINYYIKEQKINGLLESSLDENGFAKRVFEGILPEFN